MRPALRAGGAITGRVLFEHNVEIGAAKAKRRRAAATRMLRMRQPWARLLEQICSRLRIGERVDRLVDAGMGRQHAVIERKCNLGHAGDTGRGLGVTEQGLRSEEHTSELQSLMRSQYDVFCLK